MEEIGSHTVIRHAFENVVTACARLISYATGIATASDKWLINGRQDILAVDDLVSFGISARRLIENTSPPKHFSNVTIRAASKKEAGPTPIWDILNLIIHHRFIDIKRFSHQKLHGSALEDFLASKAKTTNTQPIIFVESDRGEMLGFKLQDLVLEFETEILNPIVDICA